MTTKADDTELLQATRDPLAVSDLGTASKQTMGAPGFNNEPSPPPYQWFP